LESLVSIHHPSPPWSACNEQGQTLGGLLDLHPGKTMEKDCQPEIFHTKNLQPENHLKPNLQIIVFQWGVHRYTIKVVVGTHQGDG